MQKKHETRINTGNNCRKTSMTTEPLCVFAFHNSKFTRYPFSFSASVRTGTWLAWLAWPETVDGVSPVVHHICPRPTRCVVQARHIISKEQLRSLSINNFRSLLHPISPIMTSWCLARWRDGVMTSMYVDLTFPSSAPSPIRIWPIIPEEEIELLPFCPFLESGALSPPFTSTVIQILSRSDSKALPATTHPSPG